MDAFKSNVRFSVDALELKELRRKAAEWDKLVLLDKIESFMDEVCPSCYELRSECTCCPDCGEPMQPGWKRCHGR
jgi:hypothetical protein